MKAHGVLPEAPSVYNQVSHNTMKIKTWGDWYFSHSQSIIFDRGEMKNLHISNLGSNSEPSEWESGVLCQDYQILQVPLGKEKPVIAFQFFPYRIQYHL
jgi:hypothetical protein